MWRNGACLAALALTVLFGATTALAEPLAEISVCEPETLGCGTLRDPGLCPQWIWDSPQWGRLLIWPPAGFSPGQTVLVIGTIDTGCWSTCQIGDGCLLQTSVYACKTPTDVQPMTWGRLKSRY